MFVLRHHRAENDSPDAAYFWRMGRHRGSYLCERRDTDSILSDLRSGADSGPPEKTTYLRRVEGDDGSYRPFCRKERTCLYRVRDRRNGRSVSRRNSAKRQPGRCSGYFTGKADRRRFPGSRRSRRNLWKRNCRSGPAVSGSPRFDAGRHCLAADSGHDKPCVRRLGDDL